MKKVTVVGAGTMGNGIAHVFAQSGYQVNLLDVSEEALSQGFNTINKNLDRQLKKEKITSKEKETTLSNITTTTSELEAYKNTWLIIEAATENIDLKTNIFKSISETCDKNTIIATNTSSISITKLASATKYPENVIGMHFMNPVPVMKLIEIIKGYKTSKKTLEIITETAKKLNKIPIQVNDYPGFIANRILMPMINEAIISLQEGVAGVKEIDHIMKLGMSHPMGPLQLADFIGLDVCLSILNVMYKGFGKDKYAPASLLTNMVEAKNLGIKTKIGFYNYSNGLKDAIVSKKFEK